MSKADSEKLLKKIEKFVGNEVRKTVAKQYTKVTFTAKGVGQGIKEGYQALAERLVEDYVEISDEDFTKRIGSVAVDEVYKWASLDTTTPHEVVEYTKGESVTYLARRDVIRPYSIAKNKAVAELQKIRELLGFRKLRGKTAADKTAATSEIGAVKSKSHKLHKGVTTVGAAQLAASMNYLERTKDFSGFASSEEAKELMDLFKEVRFVWSTTGSKAKGAKISLNENLYVEMIVDSMSKNPAGGEPFDWKNIKPVFEKAIKLYIEKNNIPDQKGSKSIRENAIDATEHLVVSALTKGPRVKASKKTQDSVRKKTKTDITTKASRKKPKVSKKTTRTRRVRTQSAASMPLYLVGLLNKELPKVVAKNMESPALEYQTGRFASSVKVTDIAMTAQGFPSIGYTYDKYPYQTFEPGYRQGDPDRDPRKLINSSIREIAAQYAIGRFYTRRV